MKLCETIGPCPSLIITIEQTAVSIAEIPLMQAVHQLNHHSNKNYSFLETVNGCG